MPRTVRGTLSKRNIGRIAGSLCLVIFVPLAWGATRPPTVTNPAGNPIRKVYVRTQSPQSVSNAIARLAQDTCLTIVPSPKDADAILNLGQALREPVVSGMPTPHVFGPSARGEATDSLNSRGQRNPTPPCDNRRSTGCATPQGDVTSPPSGWPGDADGDLSISLASVGPDSQELWEPRRQTRKSWTHQLRIAVGCPVCPGERYDRHKYKSYRNWIQKQCPSMLEAPASLKTSTTP